MADFQRELEAYTGHSWDEFFKHWLYGAGLCDWAVDKVEIQPIVNGTPHAENFLDALHADKATPCQVTVMLCQKGEYDEPTVLGFCMDACGRKDEDRLPYQIRIPIEPQAQMVEHPEYSARVETLPDHKVRV